ncbi:MAG: NAD(P)/FAD-dependent oxidoreductase [Ruegeria sp.]
MFRPNDQDPVWSLSSDAQKSYPSLWDDLRCDVAIIGAGYTGLSAALRLAEAGKSVVVLEAVHVGRGGSGRNAGMVNSGLWLDPDDVAATVGPKVGKRLNSALACGPDRVFDLIAKHRIQCAVQRAGSIQLAYSETDVEKLQRRNGQMSKLGCDVHMVHGDACSDVVGTHRYQTGLIDKRAGSINPLAYCRGLAQAAEQAGALVFEDTRVTGLQRASDVWCCETERSKVTADTVVIATNALTAKRDFPRIPAPIIPVPFFQFATDPLDADGEAVLPQGHCAWDTRDVAFCFRKDSENRLVMGSVGSLNGIRMALARRWLSAETRWLFPKLGQVGWQLSWTGTIGFTANHVPSYFQPAPNLIAPSGYNGRGIAPGTVFGTNIADYLISGSKDALLLPLKAPVGHVLPRQKAQMMDWGAAAKRVFRTWKLAT